MQMCVVINGLRFTTKNDNKTCPATETQQDTANDYFLMILLFSPSVINNDLLLIYPICFVVQKGN